MPELLSPVANLKMCKAAVQNGAEAIYVGVPSFNARRHGANSTIEELKQITEFCRLHDVKVYFACNILIYEEELQNFAETARPWLELMPDAVILQDIGLAKWFREAAPWMPIHASTQMTIASSGAVRIAEEMGFSRCVLARELSIEQIKEIRRDCPNMELEVFVHGALCVSFSGQCNASEIFGGRSANRGDCAQCCRLPYKIFIDSKFKEQNYALSTSDLCALPILDELLQTGIHSLKIEGRLKSAEYVATVTKAYRDAMDSVGATPCGRPFPRPEYAIAFSRGFTTGWLKNEVVVNGNTTGHLGLFIGNIEKVKKNKVWVKSTSYIKNGDGILMINGEKRFGGRVYGIEDNCIIFSKDKNFSELNSDFKIYINDTNETFKEQKIPFKVEINPTPNMNQKMIRQLKQQAIKAKIHREFPGILSRFQFPVGATLAVAPCTIKYPITPQIHTNSDVKILDKIIVQKPDAIIVRSLGAFEYLRDKGIKLIADSSLNICNSLSAKYFLENGVKEIHNSKPCAFHTKHCLFSASLANHKKFPHCGQPCKTHKLELQDHKGKMLKVIADEACRNSVLYR